MNRNFLASALAIVFLCGLQGEAANASSGAALPIVTDHVNDGVRELQIIFPQQQKTVELFKAGAARSFKKQLFDKDSVLTQEQNYDEKGKLMSEFTFDKDKVKHWRQFDAATGKQTEEKKEFPDGRIHELKFRPDGLTVWTLKETRQAGATTLHYYAPDGQTLVREIHPDHMTVEVFDKQKSFLYGQSWDKKGNAYRLKEIHIGHGHTQRVVIMKEDGVTVDHVDYQVCGIVSWATIKTEPGDKLSEPIDAQMLQELNRADDITIPAQDQAPAEDKK